MKNSLLFLFILLFITVHFNLNADESYPKKIKSPKLNKLSKYDQPRNSRTEPEVEFSIAPIEIATSYNNYMIGGKYFPPIVRQPNTAAPNEYPAGGIYTSFMYQETQSSPNRVYYSYVDNGDPSVSAPIGFNNIEESSMSIALDPVTANPLVVIQADYDGDGLDEIVLKIDYYNIVGAPGIWLETELMNETTSELIGFEHFQNPVIKIGQSPAYEYRRAHLFAKARVVGSEEVYTTVYGYADFKWNSADYGMDISEWSFQTLPLLDTWQVDEGKWVNKNIFVSQYDDTVIFAGFTQEDYFFLVSSDYGQTFEENIIDARWYIDNPQNQDGSYFFTNEDGTPAVPLFAPSRAAGNFNIQPSGYHAIVFPAAMTIVTEEQIINDSISYEYFYPKMFRYDFEQNQFSFVDIQTTGVDPYDNQPAIPWDLDEDGEVDDHYEDEVGTVYFADSWPSYYFGGDYMSDSINRSTFYLSASNHGQFQTLMFQDSRKHRQALFENEDYLDWYEKAEIAICQSDDYGFSWSEIAYLDGMIFSENYYSELENMNPCYIYPVDELWVMNENDQYSHDATVKVPILFYDSANYLDEVPPMEQIPGKVMYAELILNPDDSAVDENIVSPNEVFFNNYPNPFNPSTEISFSFTIENTEDTEIEIYNIKGQKVTTFECHPEPDEGRQTESVTWNGTDQHNNPVASGIYFAALKTDGKVIASRKMMLLK